MTDQFNIQDIDIHVANIDVNIHRHQPVSYVKHFHFDLVIPRGASIYANVPEHPEINFVVINLNTDGTYGALRELDRDKVTFFDFGDKPVMVRVIPVFEKTQEYVDDLRMKHSSLTIHDAYQSELLARQTERSSQQAQREATLILDDIAENKTTFVEIHDLNEIEPKITDRINHIVYAGIGKRELILYTDPLTSTRFNRDRLDVRVVVTTDPRWACKVAIVCLMNNASSKELCLSTLVAIEAFDVEPAFRPYAVKPDPHAD